MKRIALSMAVAAMVMMSGCGEKKSDSTQHETVQTSAGVESEAAAPVARPVEKKTAPVSSAPHPVEENVTAAKEKAAEKMETISESVKEEARKEATGAVEPKAAGAEVKTDAAALFAKCVGCHGPKGEKHALGKSNIIAGQSKEDLVKKMEGYKNGTYGGPMKGIMAGQVRSLTSGQIDALADYIAKLK
jgi:cytochrome c553